MLPIIKKAAKEGGEVLLEYFRKEYEITHKTSHRNLVTEADHKSQKLIKDVIEHSLINKGVSKKDIGFIGEEKLYKNAKHLFIIDPLDGTVNFASGLKIFFVLIAYYKNGKAQSAVMYEPYSKTFYLAELGRGAYRIERGKKKRLRITSKRLKNSMAVGGISRHSDIHPLHLKFYNNISPHVRAMRTTGCAGYDFAGLLDNIFGLVVLGKAFIWDLAPAKLMIEESGAVLTDWKGKPIKFNLKKPNKGYSVVACFPNKLKKIISFF